MNAARSTALALLLVVVAVAGCNALPETDADADADDPAAAATPLPVASATPTWTSTPTPHSHPMRYPVGAPNLGEHEAPHGVRLVNDRDEATVEVTLQLTHEDDDDSFENTYTLSPGEELYGVLVSKANYTVTVTAGDLNATEQLSKALFDCNDSTTTFTVTRDDVTTRTVSTAVGCPTESPE